MAEPTQAELDFQAVGEFRRRLVEYINLVLSSRDGMYGFSADDEKMRRIAAQHTPLSIEYGRLFRVINRNGGMSMGSPAAGITVVDVVADAINNPGAISYGDIARLAEQHVNTVLGQLAGEADESERRARRAREARGAEEARKAEERAARAARRAADPDHWFRLTSPLFWIGRLVALVRWLFGSTKRVVASAAGLVLVGAILSGAAQAIVSWLLQLISSGP